MNRVPEPFELPDELARAAALDRHDRRRDWLARLPVIVAAVAERWDLTVGRPFQPGGQGSWTAPARRGDGPDGGDLVVKVGWTHDEGVHEAAALRLWGGRGSVLLHDDWVEGDTTALLMERARPGVPLGDSLPEEEQDLVVAGLLHHVWVPPPVGHPFRPLSSMCDLWADEAESLGLPGQDAGLLRAALELFRALPREPRDDDVLLVTDLHAGNVLAGERRPWLVIDPKPYVGDPCYDPLQHLFNGLDRVAADPEGVALRTADLCAVDPERFRRWLFARWVVEATWAEPADQPGLLAVARALAP